MNKSKELKKMSRKDLLEILVLQSKKIDELTLELENANKVLKSRDILIKESGSIAEASLKLNKIFEIAQETADLYLDNIKKLEAEIKEKKNKKTEKKKISNTKKKKIRKA